MQCEIFTPYMRMQARCCNISEPLNNFFPFGRVVYFDSYAYAYCYLVLNQFFIFYRSNSGYHDTVMNEFINLIPFPELSYAICNRNVAALDILSVNENFMKCLKYLGDYYSQEYGQNQQLSLIWYLHTLRNIWKQKIFIFSYDDNFFLKYSEFVQDSCSYSIYVFIQQNSNNFVIFYPRQGLNHYDMIEKLFRTVDANSSNHIINYHIPNNIPTKTQCSEKLNVLKNQMHEVKKKAINPKIEAECNACKKVFGYEKLLKLEKSFFCFECAKEHSKGQSKGKNQIVFNSVQSFDGTKFTKLECCAKKDMKVKLNTKNKYFIHVKCLK
ncbi:hypothetical protein SteCoe_23470 [Stentor coeruleus]|uniref:Uncharacterized protein n=1 Tax=Stentor coeruleus TaxID=5963 RepID=A0A1R2BJT7_9CILI|nr:hypothetical protein SteCoe_23470 [Stentor coeruleus]